MMADGDAKSGRRGGRKGGAQNLASGIGGGDQDADIAARTLLNLVVFAPPSEAQEDKEVNELRVLQPHIRSSFLRQAAARLIEAEAKDGRTGRDLIAMRFRQWLDPWDSMLLCADLSISNDASAQSDHVVDRRLAALAEEAFQWAPELQFAELTLYTNDSRNQQVDDEERIDDGTNIQVRHCFAVRGGNEVAAWAAARAKSDNPLDSKMSKEDAYVEFYRTLLVKYVAEWGTSIQRDGHISRDPRNALQSREGVFLRRVEATAPPVKPFVSQPKKMNMTAPQRPTPGEDDRFVIDAVRPIVSGSKPNGKCLVHFMEGIDQDFHDTGKRVRNVAHMFLVFSSEYDKPSAVSEFSRNMQTLLLRFCAHFMANNAARATYNADKQREEARAREIRARADRDGLSARAREVRDSIQQLQQAALKLQTHIDDNPTLDHFARWLRALKPLFRTDEVFDQGPVPVTGDHLSWSREQLAAALWAYAEPTRPSWVTGVGVRMDRLWDSASLDWDHQTLLNNARLFVLHRHGNFYPISRMSETNLRETFFAMKRWHRAHVDSEMEEAGGRYRLSQIMFLLGNPNFNDYGADRVDESKNEKKDDTFEFPSPRMFEGLIRFTNSIARGLIEIEQKDKANYTVDETNIIGGIVAIEAQVVSGQEEGDSDFGVLEPGTPPIAGSLVVRIRQNPKLAERDKVPPEVSYKALVKQMIVRARDPAAIKLARDGVAGEGGDQGSADGVHEWSRSWIETGGKNETSTAAAQALGCSAKYRHNKVQSDRGEGEEIYAKGQRDGDLGLISYLHNAKEPLAKLSIDPVRHEFVFTFKPRGAMKDYE